MSVRAAVLGLLATVALTALCEDSGAASTRSPLGAVIENRQLSTTSGGKESILGKGVSVLLFVRPDTQHSREAVKSLSGCEQRLSGKAVRWVAIVSDRYKPEEVADFAKATGLTLPVLVDSGESLQTELALAQLPEAAIIDASGKLSALQPAVRVNFCEAINARARFALGELTRAQMESELDPSTKDISGEDSAARRYVKLAEAFLKSGNTAKAGEAARKAVEGGNDLAAAHSILGEVLRVSGDCAGARPEFEKALAIEAQDARAREGLSACAAK